MLPVELIEYENASAEVRSVFDDIMATRKVDKVNNFWKALANHPVTLRRTWESVKTGDGARRTRSSHEGADLHRCKRH